MLPKPSGTSATALIVDVQHDRIAGRFKPQHGGGEEIARNGLDDILGESAKPAAAICPAASRVVLEDDLVLAEFAGLEMRLGIGQAPAARQRQIKRAADDFSARLPRMTRSWCAARDTAFFQIMPEAHCGGVRAAPFAFEGFNLGVGVGVAGIKAAPCTKTAAEAEGKIADFADRPGRIRPRASPHAAISSTQ